MKWLLFLFWIMVVFSMNSCIEATHILRPDNTQWEWTQDNRGLGSQNSLIVNEGILSILPVNHVHFVNRKVNNGNAVYKFKVRGNNFKFAWRVSLNVSSRGKALVLQKNPGTTINIIHINWQDFYFGWHNSFNYFSNSINLQIDSTSWHAVEIHDSGKDIKISIDGIYYDFFKDQIAVSEFLKDVGTGGLGIGNDEYETISYKDMEVIK